VPRSAPESDAIGATEQRVGIDELKDRLETLKAREYRGGTAGVEREST